MSVDLAKLVVTLEAESARYQKQLAQAQSKLAKFDKSAQASAVAIGTVVGNAMTQVARSFFAAGTAAIEYADKAGKAAQAAGTSVEFFSQLAYTAGLANVSTEDLGSNLAKFTKNIGEALQGTKSQVEAFDMLGISQETLRSSSPEEVFLLVADAMSNMADGSKKNLAAQALFSKSFATMLPLLNQGADDIRRLNGEADTLGLTVTDKAARAADEFGDKLDKMNAAARGVANTVMQDLNPVMSEIADEFLRASTEGGGFRAVGEALRGVLQTLTVVGSDIAFVFKGIGGEIGVIAAQAAQLAQGNLKGAKLIGEEWTRDIANARIELDAFQKRVMSAGEAAASAGRQGGATATDWAAKTKTLSSEIEDTSGKTKKLKDTVGDLLRELEKQGAVMNMTAGALAAYNVTMAGGTAVQAERARMLATSNDLMEKQKSAMEAGKALTEQMRTPIEVLIAREAELGTLLAQGAIDTQTYDRAMKDAQETFRTTDPELVKLTDGFREVDAIIAQTTSGTLEEATRQVEALAAAYEKGRFGAYGSTEAAKAYAEAVLVVTEQANSKSKDQTDEMSEYAKSAAKNMQSAFADFLFDPFAGDIKDMGDNFVKMLQRLAAEAAAAQIFDAMGFGTGSKGKMTAGSVSGGSQGNGWLNAIGGVISAWAGSAFSSSGSSSSPAPVEVRTPNSSTAVAQNARGGMVQPGELSWVGEKGPELAAAGTATKILNSRDSLTLAGGRGTTIQNINITTPNADSFRRSERQVARSAKGALANG